MIHFLPMWLDKLDRIEKKTIDFLFKKKIIVNRKRMVL